MVVSVHCLDIGLLVLNFSLRVLVLNSFEEKSLKCFPSPYLDTTCIVRQACEVLVTYRRVKPNCGFLQ